MGDQEENKPLLRNVEQSDWLYKRLTVTKPLSQAAVSALPDDSEEGGDKPARLRRCLTLWDLFWFGTGKMFGAGIFVMLGVAAQTAGGGMQLCLAYTFAGLAAMCSAMVYGEFVSRAPSAGSAYAFVYSELGELAAWGVGWLLLFDYGVGAATIARGWNNYFVNVLEMFVGQDKLPRIFYPYPIYGSEAFQFSLPTLVLILTVGAIVTSGIRSAANTGQAVSMLKIGGSILAIIIAFLHADINNWSQSEATRVTSSGETGIFAASTVVFYAFVGFDAVTVTAEELVDPARTMPKALMLCVAFTGMLYVAVSASITLMVPAHVLDTKAPFAKAFTQYSPNLKWMELFLSIAACIGLTAGVVMNLTSQPRVWMVLARDGFLPGVLAEVNQITRTPLIASIFAVSLAAVVGSCVDFAVLVDMVSLGILLALSAVCLSHVILHRRQPHSETASHVPFYVLLYVFGCMAVGGSYRSDGENKFIWFIASLAVVVIMAILIFASPQADLKAKQAMSGDYVFQAPGGVVTSLCGALANIFMMAQLDLVWAGIFGWMSAGFLIYAFYGIFHSRQPIQSS